MDPSFSRRGKITDRLLSKSVLSPIVHGLEPPSEIVEYLGIGSDVEGIRQIYLDYSSGERERPKYLPFYRAIQDKFPEFDWRINESDEAVHSVLAKPFIGYKRPSLLTLLTCCVRGDIRAGCALKAAYPSARDLPDALTRELATFMATHNFHQSSEIFFERAARAIGRALAGEPLTLISPVCPDYAYRRHRGRYRYTFDGIGDGIGLVASRILGVAPKFKDLLERHGAHVTVVIAAGDFEGFDAATLTRVGETRASFRNKLEISQGKLLSAIGYGAESVFIAELAGGEADWRKLTDRALVAVEERRLQDARIAAQFEEARMARRALYQAWHPGRNEQVIMDVLASQAAEYAAMGALFTQVYSNPLVLGCDHCRMLPFYSIMDDIPVVYLNSVY